MDTNTFVIQCFKCGKTLHCATRDIGKMVNCPRCRNPIIASAAIQQTQTSSVDLPAIKLQDSKPLAPRPKRYERSVLNEIFGCRGIAAQESRRRVEDVEVHTERIVDRTGSHLGTAAPRRTASHRSADRRPNRNMSLAITASKSKLARLARGNNRRPIHKCWQRRSATYR